MTPKRAGAFQQKGKFMNRIAFNGEHIVEGETWKKLAFSAQFKGNALADLCGVSLRTLQRYFSRHGVGTVSDWLQSIRLDEAYKRLKEGIRVKEVAYDLGYKQLSQFSRDFKNRYGIPPSSLNGSKLSLGERMIKSAKKREPFNKAENGVPFREPLLH
jgi:AraC-like DNA-binding protein